MVLLACFLLIWPALQADAQRRIRREVMGSGGRPVTSQESGRIAHGTISQTVIGRLQRDNDFAHNVGFWYWAKPFGSSVCIRVGEAAAEPGTNLTIPIWLENSEKLLRRGPLRYRIRIRYNGTLLEPRENTPNCQWYEQDCILEYEGVVSSEEGLLVEFPFTSKLGNDISTPLVIESFEWLDVGEREIETCLKHGRFTLLGVCRVGDQVRLIFGHGVPARVSVMPNPVQEWASVEFVSDELGMVRVSLIDAIGVERMVLVEEEVEAARAYRMDVDFSTLSSGSYFLIMQTPNVTKTVPLIIQQ